MEMSLSISTTGGTKAGKIWWHRLLGFLPPSNWNQLGQLVLPQPQQIQQDVCGWRSILCGQTFFWGGEIIPKMEFPRAISNCKGPQAGKIPRSHGYFLQPTCCHLAGKTFIYLYISFHLLALFPQCPVEQLCCSIPSRTRSLTHRTALLQLPGYTLHQIWSLEKNLKMKKTPGC